jgi:hypothetical protein
MAGTKLSETDIRRMTNSDELVGAPVREGGPLGEGQALPLQVIPPKRSTTDPFEANFASVDMIAAYDRPVNPLMRAFTWIFIAIPTVAAWLLGTAEYFSSTPLENPNLFTRIFEIIVVALGGILSLLWPYVLLRRPKNKSKG